MRKVKIGKKLIDSLSLPESGRAFIWDSEIPGFGLMLTAAGSKSYILQYRLHGRPYRYTISKVGALPPHKARERAGKLRAKVTEGIGPAQVKAEERQALTVRELCNLYEAEGMGTKKPSTIATDKGRIKGHIIPLLGSHRAKDVDRGDIERFMMAVAQGRTRTDRKGEKKRSRIIVRGGKGTAARTVGLLGAIFAWGESRGLVARNPVRGVKRYPDRKLERFLSVKEIESLGTALAKAEKTESTYALAAIRVIAFTGARRGEILRAKWTDLDAERGFLRVDGKTGSRAIPLNRAALDVLENLSPIEGNPYIFASVQDGKGIVDLKGAWGRIREAAKLPGLRIHDLRHTLASLSAAGGEGLPIIGKLLGHRRASTTERYAHLAEDPVKAASEKVGSEIAAALAAGAAKADTGTEGKVVLLRKHRDKK